MKNKPFLISGLIFGLIGIALLITAGVSFIMNSADVVKALASLLHQSTDTITNATIAQLGFIFMIPAFIFCYKSFADTEDEADAIVSVQTVEHTETPSPVTETAAIQK